MRLVGLPLSCLDCALSKLKDRNSILLSARVQERVLYLKVGKAPYCVLWFGPKRGWWCFGFTGGLHEGLTVLFQVHVV